MIDKTNNKSKQKIIEAAKKLFLEKGYSKTTTREIAKEADENLGLIVYYFKTKDKLAQLIYQDLLDDLYGKIDYSELTYDNAIEELFFSATFSQMLMMSEEPLLNFFWELMLNNIVPTDAHKYTVLLINKIIEEYDLGVTESESYQYTVIAKGAEKVLTQKKLMGKMDVSYMDINVLTLSTSLLLLGLSKEVVDLAIDNCISRLDQEVIDLLGQ